MNVSTPSASELSAKLREAAISIRNDGTPSQVGLSEEECIEIANVIASLEEERDRLRNGWEMDRLESAEVLGEAQALLSEAEKVITPFADWCPEILEITETVGGFWRVTLSEDAPRPLVADFGAAVDLLPKLREATK